MVVVHEEVKKELPASYAKTSSITLGKLPGDIEPVIRSLSLSQASYREIE